MDEKLIRAIAEMIRCALAAHGVEPETIEFTICKPVDHEALLRSDRADQTN
jgi:hypothetical protein